MSESGQFDKVYSDTMSTSNGSQRRSVKNQSRRFLILILSGVLLTSSLCSFYESLGELNTEALECLTDNDYYGKYLSSYLVELSSSVISLLSSIFIFIILILPLVSGPEIVEQPKIASLISIVTLGQGSKSPIKTWILFSAQLIGIASCFTSLMSITTISIKLISSFTETLINVHRDGYNSNILCTIKSSLRLAVFIITIFVMVSILTLLTKYFKYKSYECKDLMVLRKSISWRHTSKCVPIFASIQIICGGLSLLSSLMGYLSIPYHWNKADFDKVKFQIFSYNLSNWLSTLPVGVSAITAGILSVITINCCSIPLKQIEDGLDDRKRNEVLNIFLYIITILFCILTQLLSYQGYFMEKFSLANKVHTLLDRVKSLNENQNQIDANDILQIFYVKISIGLFSNLFIIIFTLPLLLMITIEMYDRMWYLKEAKIDSFIKQDPQVRMNYNYVNQEMTGKVRDQDDQMFLPTGLGTIMEKENSLHLAVNNQSYHGQMMNPYNAYNYQNDPNLVYTGPNSGHTSKIDDVYIMEEMKRAFQNNFYASQNPELC